MYKVTLHTSQRITADTIRPWLNDGKTDHRSNYLFVVTGSLASKSHNGTFLAALGKYLPTIQFMTIETEN